MNVLHLAYVFIYLNYSRVVINKSIYLNSCFFLWEWNKIIGDLIFRRTIKDTVMLCRFFPFSSSFFLIRFLFLVFVLFQRHSFSLSFFINSFFSRFLSNNGSTRSPCICLPLSFVVSLKPCDTYLCIKLIDFFRKVIDHLSLKIKYVNRLHKIKKNVDKIC